MPGAAGLAAHSLNYAGSLFNLILDYFGGLTNLTRVMKDKQWTLTTGPICCVCPCLPTKKTNKDWFRNLWWGAYQERFEIIKYTSFIKLGL